MFTVNKATEIFSSTNISTAYITFGLNNNMLFSTGSATLTFINNILTT